MFFFRFKLFKSLFSVIFSINWGKKSCRNAPKTKQRKSFVNAIILTPLPHDSGSTTETISSGQGDLVVG